MRPISVVAVLALALGFGAASLPARAQDGGPCILDGGTIDSTGKCDGEDAVFCGSDNTLQRMHCPALPVTATQTLQNGLCDDTTSFGAWCTFPDATSCAFLDAQNNPLDFMCGTPTDDTFGTVCDIDDGCASVNAGGLFGATCAATTPKCFGSHLRVDCTPWSQAVTLDCAKHAGNCVDNGNGDAKCVNGLNGDCDQGGTLFACASGLTCVGATASTFGACKDPNAPVDAGAQPADSGTTPPHDAGQAVEDAGTTERDAGFTARDAGETAQDAGGHVGGEGEGEGGGGISLGATPDAGNVDQRPLETGCGCSSSPAGAGLFACAAIGLALGGRRRRRSRPC